MADRESQCRARSNRTIPCDGEFVPSEGLCLRHACLFDIWIAEHGGHRVYGFKGEHDIETPTVGEKNPEKLRRWKRAQFHKWLDGLTLEAVRRMLEGR